MRALFIICILLAGCSPPEPSPDQVSQLSIEKLDGHLFVINRYGNPRFALHHPDCPCQRP